MALEKGGKRKLGREEVGERTDERNKRETGKKRPDIGKLIKPLLKCNFYNFFLPVFLSRKQSNRGKRVRGCKQLRGCTLLRVLSV